MKKHYPIIWMVMGIIFVATSVFSAPIGKVTLVEGRVDVLKAGRNVATPVSLGAPVDLGDVYRAKSNGRAEITFTNKNLMRIAPNTRIEITRYSVEGDKSNTVARLYRGRAQAIGAEDFIKKAASFAEGNRFEVHTPNAVAGIRGTNMVVIFEKGATGAVFLSGQGYMYNPQRPQQVVLIVAGTISFISSPGATPTPPRKASDAEMAMYANAFTQGSSGGGGGGGTPAGLAPVPGGGGGGPPGAGDKMPILNPPPPVIAPATQTAVPGPFYSYFNTDIWQTGSGLLYKGGITGAFEGTESLWSGSPPLVTISGAYTNSATGTAIWSSKVDNTSDPYSYTHPMWSWNETAQTATTSDGGSYVGFAGGADYNGVLEGRFVGLYIDPSKNAGTLSAPVSGTYADGIFAMLGPVSRTFKNAVTISPVDFPANDTQDGIPQSYLSGTFPATSGTMGGSFGGTILSIDDNPWGIYFLRAGGTYSLPAPSWNAKLGGYTKFGAYYTASSDLYHDHAYWIGNIANGSWGDDKITGTLNGQYVSERRMGTITGDVIGTHNSGTYGNWQAVSPGTWTGTPLTFGNWINDDLRYYDPVSGWQTDGSFDGNMGGTSSIWYSSPSSPASFKIIGKYDPLPAGGRSLIWHDGNHSRNEIYNGLPDFYTTYDGGSYDMNIGLILSTSGNISGKFAGIYIDPDGHAGLLRGSLTGTSYPDIGMLDVDGSIYRIEKGPVYLAPNQLRDAMVQHGALSGRTTRMAGTSPAGGTFTGATTDTFDNDFISFVDEANKITYPWGYYRHTLGGSHAGTMSTWSGKTGGFHYFGDYYETPTTHTGSPGYWLADIASGTWTNGEIEGAVSGTFLSETALGTLSGNVIGTYNTADHSWQAVNVGIWEGTPLTFVTKIYSTPIKFFDGASYVIDGTVNGGFMGGTASLWAATQASPAPVKIIGAYTPGVQGAHIWSFSVNQSGPMPLYISLSETDWIEDTTWTSTSYTKTNTPEGNLKVASLVLNGGVHLRTADTFNFQNAIFRYKWKMNGQGTYAGTWNGPGAAFWGLGGNITTGWSWNGSLVINSDQWVYSQLQVNPDLSYSVDLSYTGYGLGGIYHTAGTLSQGNYDALGNTWFRHRVVDNYGSGAYFEIAEAMIRDYYTSGNYKGFLAGIDHDNGLEARMVALYIDPSGKAGYLKGSFTGTAHEEIGMFEMDGSVYPVQKVSAIGLNPYNLDSSAWPSAVVSGNIAGVFPVSGNIAGSAGSVSFETMSIVNTNTGIAENWGIYKFTGYGSFSNPGSATTWTGRAGGSGNFGAYYYGTPPGGSFNDDYGNWIADITGGTWTGGELTGMLSGEFITNTKIGTLSGELLGTYYNYSAQDLWQAVSVGAWEGTPLKFATENYTFLQYYGTSTFSDNGSLNFIMGGSGSLFGTTPVSITMIGSYGTTARNVPDVWRMGVLGISDPGAGGPSIWSYNPVTGYYETGDGGIYGGIFAGTRIPGTGANPDILDGRIYAFYKNPHGTWGEMGLLVGALNGQGYADIGMFMMNGTINSRVVMESAVLTELLDGPSSNITFSSYQTNASPYTVAQFQSGGGTISFPVDVYFPWSYRQYVFNLHYDPAAAEWGIVSGSMYGTYTDPTNDSWSATLDYDKKSSWDKIHQIDVAGTKWSEMKITGAASGYGADISASVKPLTWISVGEVVGTFNPASHKWQAVHLSAWIETNRLLAMAADAAGRAELQKLNIPCVEVGMDTLTYSAAGMTNINMSNVKFFAPTSGGSPQVWATGNVNANWQTGYQPVVDTAYNLAGTAVNAQFTLKKFSHNVDNSKWIATVTNGNGQINGYAITFKGAAAGTTNATARTLSGTAAGTAK